MKTHLVTFILFIFWISNLSAQGLSILIMPGEGIVLNEDTFRIGKDRFSSTIEKLDTNQNKVYYHFGYGIACGLEQSIDSISGDTIWKDGSWGFHTGQLFFDKNVEIKFYGNSQDSMTIEKIIVKYPAIAFLENGLMIGDYYKSIFNDFDRTDSSYNCAESGPSFCYYDEGVSFRMKKYDEDPFRDMINKIIAIEVYEKYK